MPLASCASLSAIWAKTGRPRLCLTVPPVRRLPRAPLVLPALLAIATRQQLASEAPPRVPRHVVCSVITHTPAPSRPPRPACQPKTQAATAPSTAARSGRCPSPGTASEAPYCTRGIPRSAARFQSSPLKSGDIWSRRCGIADSRPRSARYERLVVTCQSQSVRLRESQAGRQGGAGSQPASQPVYTCSQSVSQSGEVSANCRVHFQKSGNGTAPPSIIGGGMGHLNSFHALGDGV